MIAEMPLVGLPDMDTQGSLDIPKRLLPPYSHNSCQTEYPPCATWDLLLLLVCPLALVSCLRHHWGIHATIPLKKSITF